jgi:hypothetical protein
MYNDVDASQVFGSKDPRQAKRSFLQATLKETEGSDGRLRKQRVPTVVRNAKQYIFDPGFLEEGLFGQFVHGNSGTETEKISKSM